MVEEVGNVGTVGKMDAKVVMVSLLSSKKLDHYNQLLCEDYIHYS